jgi:ribosomal protein S18 acetylase RimI-like enzyme
VTAPVVRPATRADRGFVRRLSAEVFARFGDYDRLLPALLDAWSVETMIVEVAGDAAGFIMVDPTGGPVGEGDLIAIAVDPRHHRRGLGRLLLEHAEGIARDGEGQPALWLTVADDNIEATALFESSGYRVVDPDHGSYAGGQRSIAMRKDLGEEPRRRGG